MGTGTFFSKVASVDPLAQALHLPGADKYAQQQASSNAGTSAYGPYTGVTPTLAGANAGYVAGGPGANANYTPWTPAQQGGLFGAAQRFASGAGATGFNPIGRGPTQPGGI
jgi:hypothetical protein